jgi:uncharacterized protein YcfL
MQKTFSILTVILFSFLLYQCTSSERALHKRLQQEAAMLNESAPVMLNDFVRFDAASVTPDNTFQYQYTVLNTSNPDSLVESSLQNLKESARIVYSTSFEMAIFRENNVTLEYIYSDESGRVIRTIEINPEDYK